MTTTNFDSHAGDGEALAVQRTEHPLTLRPLTYIEDAKPPARTPIQKGRKIREVVLVGGGGDPSMGVGGSASPGQGSKVGGGGHPTVGLAQPSSRTV